MTHFRCPIHGVEVFPGCEECLRSLEVRQRQLEWEAADRWLQRLHSEHPFFFNVAVGVVSGLVVCGALLLAKWLAP